jgi:hypothetical protein
LALRASGKLSSNVTAEEVSCMCFEKYERSLQEVERERARETELRRLELDEEEEVEPERFEEREEELVRA